MMTDCPEKREAPTTTVYTHFTPFPTKHSSLPPKQKLPSHPITRPNPDTKTSAQRLIMNLVHGIDRLTWLQYSAVTY